MLAELRAALQRDRDTLIRRQTEQVAIEKEIDEIHQWFHKEGFENEETLDADVAAFVAEVESDLATMLEEINNAA